jgi:Xaa-Pro dipeptidase
MNYADRLEQFLKQLARHADLAFLPFGAELTYLTGIPRQFPSYGAILHPGAWLEGMWLLPGREPVLALTRMTAEFAGLVSQEVKVAVLGDFEDPMRFLNNQLPGLSWGEAVRLAVGDRTMAETLIHLQQELPGLMLKSATDLLKRQRMIKDDGEIALMRQAGEVTEKAFEAVLAHLVHGMSELEVVTELNYQLRQHGAEGPSFTSEIYAVGPGHALIFGDDQSKCFRRLEPPISILFDFGAVYQGYCYDYGRTVCFGEPDEDFLFVHQLVMDSQAAGIASLRAGQPAEQVDQAARSVIELAGLGEAFRHRLGHGIGLDVHEPPFLTAGDQTVLQTGMLFTIEPSILFPGRCSARVEDVVKVGESGGVPLTSGYQELIVIE